MVYARLSLVPDILLPDLFALDHGLEGYSSATHFALMSVLLVVVVQPFFQIGLQRNLRRERTQNDYAMSELDSELPCGRAARCSVSGHSERPLSLSWHHLIALAANGRIPPIAEDASPRSKVQFGLKAVI